MNFLFVHQYFPGQYVHLVQHLQEAGHNVVFVTQRRGREIPGVRTLEYLPLPPSGAIPPHLQEVEIGVMNGLAVARLCEGLKREGFTPDVMIGHCGWGEVLFVKDVWPRISLIALDPGDRLLAQRDKALFRPLAQDADDGRIETHLDILQLHQLRDAQPGRIERLQHRAIA